MLAHELGHHVQNLLGIERRSASLQQARPDQQNALSVRLELQADCFAGVWGHQAAQPGRAAHGKVELETGDIEEGLNAAAAIGDDRIQRMAGGRVAPGSLHPRLVRAAGHLVPPRASSAATCSACETFQ